MNREIARLMKRMHLGRPIESAPVTVSSTIVNGKRIQFCTNNPADPVQHKHRNGVFYEAAELANLAALFPKGGTFVDIGAHVGNHSLFAALFMDASTVIPIEPHPAAYRLLIQNVLVNGLSDRVDLSKLGCAFAAQDVQGGSLKTNRRKPAATKLKQAGGKIPVLRGDAMLSEVTPDMIKIDTPGMEIEVLEGLSDVFSRCAPVLLIEVSAANDEAFKTWADAHGYTVSSTTKRNKNDLNYIVAPKSKANAKPAVKKATTAKKATVAKKAGTTKAKVTIKKAATAKPKVVKKVTTAASKTAKPKATTSKALLDKAF